jgi:hypothetical protein
MSVPDEFFERLTGHPPHEWQARLALDEVCRDRLIRIPTGSARPRESRLPGLAHSLGLGTITNNNSPVVEEP